jgi:diguanylate cyclase (GGDEF)-like protein/PAS domain S-box-containing protein
MMRVSRRGAAVAAWLGRVCEPYVARRLMRALLLISLIVPATTVLCADPAAALRAIDVNPEVERMDITGDGEPYQGRNDTLQIETAPGGDGLTGRMSVRASTSGTTPNWFVFALRNSTDKLMERWLVADRYNAVGSGIIWPELDRRKIETVTPSIGFVPERIQIDGADVFRITVEPGQTVTFVAEISADRLPRLQLWRGLDYEKRSRNRQLFQGILLGITGLLATFLTVLFAANHKAIFPSAALFTWCVLAYLCVDFGFWHKLFNVRPEDNAVYRAASEAGMAASLLVFTHTFLRLGFWHGFARMLIGIWMAAGLGLIAIAFIDPKLAATFARLSASGIVVTFGLVMVFLAMRGQDRALSLIPAWVLLAVWMLAAALIFAGRLGGEFAALVLTSGLVLIITLIGFIVTQFAFRTSEPFHGVQPDEQQLRSLAIEHTGAAVWEWNGRRDEVKVGNLLETAIGLKPGQLHGKMSGFLSYLHPADAERMRHTVEGLRERGSGEVRLEFRMRHVDNAFRWFELEAAAIQLGDRRAVRCIGLVREVTDEKRGKERLLHDAVHDNVTGLPNRALFLDRLTVALARAKAEPLVKPTVFFIDLDRFKSVNRSFGLVTGDSLLLTVARRLARHIGPADTLSRIGGDQFAMIFLNEHDPRELAVLAENMRRSLRAPINIGDQEIILTATIGIAMFSGAADQDGHALFSDAEIAMHKAKRQGPDQIEFFKPEMRADKDDRITIESDLRNAIEKGQIKVLYQPIMYLRTEELAGYEALVRWDHPRLGTLNPVDFIPVAEESDLIVRLGSYVLQTAVGDAQRWHKEYNRADQPFFVSVNVSTRQLFRQDLVNEIRHIMSRSLLPKGALRLEVTESLVMENPEQASEMLKALAATGVGLSLDDFGAGYSSLCYLNTFPFDTLKVDRALVHTSSETGTSSAILRSIVALAHELGKKVVAEGVENEDDIGLLRTIGCEYAQGFLYSGPITQREVLNNLKTLRKADRRQRSSTKFRVRRRPVENEASAADAGHSAAKVVAASTQRRARAARSAKPADANGAARPESLSASMAHARIRPQVASAGRGDQAPPADVRSVRVAEAAARLQAMFGAGSAPLTATKGQGAAPPSPPPVGGLPPSASQTILDTLQRLQNGPLSPQSGGHRHAQPPPLGRQQGAPAEAPPTVAEVQAAAQTQSRDAHPPALHAEAEGASASSYPVSAPPITAELRPIGTMPVQTAVQLATLPPAIAKSLAMLAGVEPPQQPASPPPLPEGPPPAE